MKKLNENILLLTALLCYVSFSSCENPIYRPTLEEEYNDILHNSIVGKWKLVGKSIYSSSYDYTNDVEVCSIKFTKFENNIFGKYTSNIFPKDLYYVVTALSSIIFYYSLEDFEFRDIDWRGNFCNWGNVIMSTNDTLCLSFAVNAGWFNDKSKYTYYYFIKMENDNE